MQATEKAVADSHQAAPALANVAQFVADQASQRPLATAVIEQRSGNRITFGELAQRVENVAHGLARLGLCNGARAVLAVRPGIDFVVCVFALFRAGAVPVVIDPGMGKASLLQCIAQAQPDALIGIPLAHALSLRHRKAFGSIKQRVTVGRRWLWGGQTLAQLQSQSVAGTTIAQTCADDTAAILFTSGATGTPKGVVYHHGAFVEQVRMIRDTYGIAAGEVDCACFALFALFSVAMGVTVVLPDIDFARPGAADPARVVAAIRDHKATMAFASPAIWRKVGPWLEANNQRLETLARVLIAGAAVPVATLAQLKPRIAPGGEIFTPYGATESLPFASISATEVLGDTRFATSDGAGVCVGAPLPGVDTRIVHVVEGPIASIDDVVDCAPGEVGEILVRSAVTTRQYFMNYDADMRSKIRVDAADGHSRTVSKAPSALWHRMGDTGCLDEKGRLWYCGRVSHTVWTAQGPLYPEQVEGIFLNHQAVSRCALVGLGDKGAQQAVVVVELHGGLPPGADLRQRIETELLQIAQAHALTRQVKRVLFHASLPVDARHNAKIDREALAVWAAAQRTSGNKQ